MSDSRFDLLTPRERDCLRGVAQHKRTKDIARELDLKPGTVDTYIASAVRKLGLSDRASAVRALIAEEASRESRSAFSGVEPIASVASPTVVERLPWPFPTRGRPKNDLTAGGKIVAILIAAMMMMVVAAFYLLAIVMISNASRL